MAESVYEARAEEAAMDEFTARGAVIVGPPFSVCASSAGGTFAGFARGVKSRATRARTP
jgi:hypothetical protein